MSDLFALDRTGLASLEDDARAAPTDFDNLTPTSWQGSGEQLKSLLLPSASAARSLAIAGSVVPITTDKALTVTRDLADAVTGKDEERRPITTNQDWFFENVVEGVGQNAVDAWTPDAASSGMAAQTMGTLFQVAGSVPQMFGTPGLFLADVSLNPAVETVRKGGSLEAAAGVGALSLGVNAVGFRLPAAFGSNLATRVGTGAGANLALGGVQNAGSQAILEADGLTEYAATWDPFNPQALLLDGLMGAAFGVKAHIDAPKVTPAQRAAILTANNADHFTRGTMPGEPRTPAAAVQHQDALDLAIRQVLAGEPVNVAGQLDLAGFDLRPELRPSPVGFQTAVARVLDDEGGFVNDPDDRGGATNFGISSRANPDVDVANLTREGAAAIYRERYWDPIDADALPADLQGIAFDAAVNQGVGWTREALAKAGGDVSKFADLREARYRQIVKDDPTQAKFLNGWLKRLRTYRQDLPNFGLAEAPRTIDDGDTFWQGVPEGENGRRETANIATPEREAMRDQWVEEHFAGLEQRILGEGERPVAYLMGGGGASGKGSLLAILQEQGEVPRGILEVDPDRIKTGGHGVSGIPEYNAMLDRGDSRAAAVVHEESSAVAARVKERAIAERRDMVVDRTLGNPAKGLAEIQALKDAGYEVRLFGVTLDPAVAVERAVKRAKGKGRYVPLRDLLTAHKGFANGFEQYAGLADQARLYDNTVSFEPIASALQGRLSIDQAQAYTQFATRRTINEKAETYRGLETSAPGEAAPAGVYARADSQGDRGQGEAGAGSGRPERLEAAGLDEAGGITPENRAAYEAIAANPDLQILDDNGVLRPASEILAEGDAAIVAAEETTRAIQAAADCFIRTGAPA